MNTDALWWIMTIYAARRGIMVTWRQEWKYVMLCAYALWAWSDQRGGWGTYFLWQRTLKSYQAIYFLMTEDFEIIPGSILSYDRGLWNHTRQYTYLQQRVLKSYQACTVLKKLSNMNSNKGTGLFLSSEINYTLTNQRHLIHTINYLN